MPFNSNDILRANLRTIRERKVQVAWPKPSELHSRGGRAERVEISAEVIMSTWKRVEANRVRKS